MEKDTVGADLTREDMAKMCSTEDILVRDKRELLVWNHRLKHCHLKHLLGTSKRGIIPRKIRKIGNIPLCITYLFEKYHKRPWREKSKISGRLRRKLSETIPGEMT